MARVILVPGAVEEASDYGAVRALLNDLDVIVMERRGHGARWREGAGHLADHISDLRALIEDRPATVVGHSIGGHAVIGLALQQPDHLEAIGLYETSLLFADWWSEDDQRTMLDEIERNTQAAKARAAEFDPDERSRIATAWECCRQDVLDGFAASFDLRALTVPVTVGYGSTSSSRGVADGFTLAKAYDTMPLIVEGAGHRAHRSHPDRFAAFVRQCIR